jgi:acetyltransferase-like isoleucine patch superfamily enzyme
MWFDGVKRIYRSLAQNPDVNVFTFLLTSAYYHLLSKHIYADHTATIRQVHNIRTNGELHIGRHYEGFMSRHDRTLVSAEGELIVNGLVSLGRGSRLYVRQGARCVLTDCSVTGLSSFVISRHLEIGAQSVVAWGCEFLDADWHTIDYPDRQPREEGICVGRHVWIGSRAQILKGVTIGDGSVIGAGSVVTRSFPSNVLVAGNPARIVRENISWHG